MALVQVLVDQREPAHIRHLKFGGVPVEVTLLDYGDVWGMCDDGCLVAIERKTASDFLNTLKDDRLFPQVTGLRALTEWAYLAITGTLSPAPGDATFCDGRRTGWNWKAVTGALLDVQELGVRVLNVAGDFDFESEVIRLANRSRSEIRFAAPRQASVLSDAEQILTAFPGIGREKALALLQACGTAAWAIACLTDSQWAGDPVPGLGEGLRRRARKALGLDAGRVLFPIDASTNERTAA